MHAQTASDFESWRYRQFDDEIRHTLERTFAVTNPQTFPANITLEGLGRRCLRNRHEGRINDVPKKGEAVFSLRD
jgi:hypothetical protein